MLKFLTRFSALMAVLIISALPLDAFAIRPRYKAVSYNTTRPAFERLVRGLSPTMDIRPGKSTTTDLESIRVNQIDSTIGSVSFTQGTDANKPLLTEGGNWENRQGYSESFSGAGWVEDGLTLSTNTLTATAGGTTHRLYSASTNRAYSTGAGEKVRITYILKYVNHPYVGIFDGGGANWDGASINLQTCSLDTGTASYTGSSFQVDADSKCIASIEYTQADTASTVVPQPCFLETAGKNSCSTWSAAGTEQFEIYGISVQGQEMNPTYIPTQTLPRHGSLTGQRGLRGDSTDYLATAAYNSATDFTGDFSLFAIVEPTGFSSSTNYTILDNETFNTKGVIWRLEGDNVDSLGMAFRTNQAAAYTQIVPSGSYPIYPHVPVIASAHKSSTSGSLFFDLDSYKTGTLDDAVSASTNVTGLMAQDSGAQPLNGYFYRAVGYKKALSTSTRQRLMKGFKRFYRVN